MEKVCAVSWYDKAAVFFKKNIFIFSFVFLYFLSIWPFLSLRYIPFHDLPQHLAAGAALRDIVLGGSLSHNFKLDGFFPNMLAWFLIAFFSLFFDFPTAGKIIVLGYFLITPLSIYYFMEGRRKHLSLVSFLFLNNYSLNMGFVNFILAISLLFLSLGAYRKGSKLFYIFALLLFCAHAAVYGLFIVILLAFYLPQKKGTTKVVYALCLLALLLASVLLYPNKQPSETTHFEYFTNLSIPEILVYGAWENLGQSLFNMFQFFRTDYVGLLGFIVLAILYGRQLFFTGEYDKSTLFASTLILFITVFFPPAVPLGGGVWNTFNGRLFPIATLFVITDLRPAKRQEIPLLLFFTVLVFINSATLLEPYHTADSRLDAYYAPVIDELEPGGRIYLVEETYARPGYLFTSNHTLGVSPFTHFLTGFYSLKGGFSSNYFGEGPFATQWPVRYVNRTYFPLCRRNLSYVCHECKGWGAECDEKANATAFSPDATERHCYPCAHPLAVVCRTDEAPGYDGKFIISPSCIPCERQDLKCISENEIIRSNFDYVVAFSTSDDIRFYKMDDSFQTPKLINDDLIVYAVNKV